MYTEDIAQARHWHRYSAKRAALMRRYALTASLSTGNGDEL